MESYELMHKVEELLEKSKGTAILSTVDENGRPCSRWMMATTLKGSQGVLYSITSPHFCKSRHLSNNVFVEWMIQTPALDQIINLKGRGIIIDNPSIRQMVIENLGSRLSVFWKIHDNISNFVVLETVVEEASYYLPMKAVTEKVKFIQGA